MPFTTFFANSLINFTRGITFTSPSLIYAALFTADPGASGSANEVSGSGYSRQVLWLDAASGKATANGSALSFTSMPACNVVYAGYTNVPTGGSQFYMTGSLSASKIVNSGDTFQFAIGDFDLILT